MATDPHDASVGVKLGALLEPLRDQITLAQPEPEPALEPPRRRLDEHELMELIFRHLDRENPYVCEGIEFERLEILTESKATPEPPPSPAVTIAPEQPAPPVDPQPDPQLDPLAPKSWIGRDWADDIATIPAAMLDRPTLDPVQLELIERAVKHTGATLNLRHLHRGPALHHLRLFVHMCRSNRVRVCRVITGKGIDSRGEPVLKRAAIEWCRGDGREAVLRWAPQLDRHGEWGTLVLELRSRLVR